MAAFGPLSIDMYLPSLPTIAADFGVPVSDAQLTLSAFFIGFAGGQLIYGPLSDRFGRRPVVMWGIAIYVATSIVCALSTGVGMMIAARVLQAMGGSAGTVTSRAIVRDCFETDGAARIMSLMVLVTGMAPLAAPLIGGQVLLWAGWRAIFWVLAGFGVLCLTAVALRVPETRAPHSVRPLRLGTVLTAYLRVARHRQAIGCILTGALAFSGMFAYITGTPYVYIELFGISPQHYGFLFGLNVIALMTGAFVNSLLVTRIGSGSMLLFGTLQAATAGITLLALVWSGTGALLGIVVPLFAYIGSLTLISSNAMARALHHFPESAGTAAALYGAIQFGLGAGAGLIVARLHDGTALPMAMVICAAGLLSLSVQRLLVRDRPLLR